MNRFRQSDSTILVSNLAPYLFVLHILVFRFFPRLEGALDAEMEGFEPPLELPLDLISNQAPSATRPHLQTFSSSVLATLGYVVNP